MTIEHTNKSLTGCVADRLRQMIVLDEIPPGERLRERHLAAVLNVSRTPLSKAFAILAAEGLVDLSPNRGATVSGFSSEDVIEKLMVLAALERLAGELACDNATDDEIAEIRALHHEMLAAFSRSDRKAYFQANQAIHLAIAEASGNSALVETHGRLNTQLYRVRYVSNLNNALWPTAVEEHEHILEALAARNREKLGALLFAHLGSTSIKFEAIKDRLEVLPVPEDGID
uniref:GntR family transcriptional regulator n=1 Tax=Pararhizobium sp. IMCC3301 TaxID=3067904 RepID=UPI0027409EA7|nr:GntR family transcriptional regulator [Pararhizobium sp. IMCC3301]